ncbi:uncharacterized protein LOC142588790 [Dermacentor variabilis]|uniref:uncharacterized protein LOC142588790 n=1 Tax=Dermacentor variabilis TaxID=34621 RepID=UPI003F5BC2E4
MPLFARLEPLERDMSAWQDCEEQVRVFFRANDTPDAKHRGIFQASCKTRIFTLLLDHLKPAMRQVKTLVTGSDGGDHLQNAENVLARLQDGGLKLKLKKSSLPNLRDHLQVPDLLLRDGQQGVWKTQQDRTFQRRDKLITKAAVLVHFDPTELVVLITDALPYGVRAILAHQDKDGQERPVSLASLQLHAAEQHHNQQDKEALALTFGVKRFHQYCGKDLGPADALSPHPLLKVHYAAEPGEVFTLEHTYPEVLLRSSVSLATSRDPVLAQVVKAVSRRYELVQQAYSQKAADLSLQQRSLLWGSEVVIPQSPVQGPAVAARGHPGVENTKGHSFLVVVDGFLKWVVVLPVPTPSAGTITAALQKFFSTQGLPHVIVYEKGPAFARIE